MRYIGVTGEISGYSPQPNGNVYFDLKDRDAVIRCVAWSEAAANLPPLANGSAVVAIGSVGVFAKKSMFSLTVVSVELEGAGRLHALYEALKARLKSEGLFEQSRKRTLPRFPFHVALVSSSTANGAGDFLAQAKALAPHVRVELFETPVQGANAAPEIVRAIDRASRSAADLVVLARGGGSFEDLFVFNDERIVRALARCAHPTVSAIGHEADTPLTDFVADRRAATPSTAAQTVLPRRADVLRDLAESGARLARGARRTVVTQRREYERIERRSPLAAPERLLAARRLAVDAATGELWRAGQSQLAFRAQALGALKTRLESVNPSVRLSQRRERLAHLRHALGQTAHARVRAKMQRLAALVERLQAASPGLRLSRGREHLAVLSYALDAGGRGGIERRRRRFAVAAARLAPAAAAAAAKRRARLDVLEAQLDGRNPTAILQRGYAIVTRGGRILRDPLGAEPGSAITAQLAGGTLVARVESGHRDGGDQSGNL